MKAIVYVRISEDRGGLAAGVQRQREDCERLAQQRGWTVAGVETDNDISAYSGKHRPGFEGALKAIAAGEADVLVAWSLDRLQRNRRDELRLYELCRDKGVLLSLVNGADLDFSTAAGRFVADMLGSSARLEVEMKSDRHKRANAQAALAGRRTGGRRPFGYEPDGVTVREQEAAAVRDGYAALLAGVPIAGIAREWNSRGLVTGQTRYGAAHKGEPSPWTRSSVKDVLTNPRYMGKRAHKGEIVADAVWPALVEEGTWLAVQDVLKDPARRRTAPRSETYLLSGLAFCGVCGGGIHGAGNTRPGVRGYRCKATTGHVSRMAEPVEDYVSQVIVARLSRPDAARLLRTGTGPDIEGMRTQAMALRERLDGLAVEFADGELTASQLRTATERLRGKLAEAEAALADSAKVDTLGPLVLAGDVQAAWDAMDTARRRAVVDMLVTVTIHPPGRGVRTFRPETVIIEPK
ncbi:recombinase family protein [Pseudarthrobacter sp. WHRI 8279]|uniref:recombinase family protein n=1 Tax=Pseudarthrobacter sp. WHRI 8279 TaxID=3162566 RepID=UPI0032EEA3E8